jgi:hypothetical protein
VSIDDGVDARDRSAEERARRDTSRPKMAPTSPGHTRETSSFHPRPAGRGTTRQAEIGVDHLHLGPEPAQPDGLVGKRILAAVDSALLRTWARLDWRM